jgi:pimeloyl-ACP methyl ester carboxylesterase
MRTVPVVAAAMLQLLGSSAALAAEPVASRDYFIASVDPDILLSVRFKLTDEARRQFTSAEIVLFVHGATLSSRAAFDPPHRDASWANWMARHGYAVYLMDVRNYGGSTRQKAMDEPPHGNPAPSRAFEAIRDIGAVVDHVRAKHGVAQVNLIGWSWGATTAGYYASLYPEKVRRLILYAPIYRGQEEAEPYSPMGAYGFVPATATRLKEAWAKNFPLPPGELPRDDSIVDAVAAEIRASDPTSGSRDPATARFPMGCLEDLHLAHIGRPLWNASTIEASTLVIVGDKDPISPPVHAEALMRDLTRARSKKVSVIEGTTHVAQFEAKRFQLFETVDAFLRGTDSVRPEEAR